MRFLILFFVCCTTLACSTHTTRGVQAVVYEKTNSYTFTFKQHHAATSVQQVVTTLLPALNDAASNKLTLSYRQAPTRRIAQAIKARLAENGMAPSLITLERDPRLDHDMTITHWQYGLKTERCGRDLLGRRDQHMGCYVDSLRLQHVRYPEHL